MQIITELEEKLVNLEVNPKERLEKAVKYDKLLREDPIPDFKHRDSISYYKKTLIIPEPGDIVLWSGCDSDHHYLLLITEVNMNLKKKS